MRDYAKFSPAMWTRGSGRRLRGHPMAQALASYLASCHHGNMLGLYYLSLVTAADDLGWSLDDVRAALTKVEEAGFAHYDEEARLVWVENVAQIEFGDGTELGAKRRAGVEKELRRFGRHRFVDMFLTRYASDYGLTFQSHRNDRIPYPATENTVSGTAGYPLDQKQKQQQQQQQQQPAGDGDAVECEEMSEPEPEPPPVMAKDRYREAYERGVSQGKGGPYAMPREQEGHLHQAILTFAKGGKTGKPLRDDRLLEWITAFAEEFAWFVAKHKNPEAVGWYSGYGPKGLLKYLNEQSNQREEREVG